MTGPCTSTTHRFFLFDRLPVGIPDQAGWVAQVIIRECRRCGLTEAIHGREHLVQHRNQLLSWEGWTALGPAGGMSDLEAVAWVTEEKASMPTAPSLRAHHAS